jgi:polyadenylate-binding protein 2
MPRCRIAYIEFADKESAIKAKLLNESLFKGRQLSVESKRKNIRGMSRGGIGFGGRGGAGNPMAMMM